MLEISLGYMRESIDPRSKTPFVATAFRTVQKEPAKKSWWKSPPKKA